jgi:hypothetical protein
MVLTLAIQRSSPRRKIWLPRAKIGTDLKKQMEFQENDGTKRHGEKEKDALMQKAERRRKQ